MPIKKLPITKKCFKCHQLIIVKFCPPTKEYVKKNNWGYWTEKEEDKDKYICSKCLKEFYQQNFLSFKEQVAEKKRKIIKVYLSLQIL